MESVTKGAPMEARDYFPIVEDFLRKIYAEDVAGLALVALLKPGRKDDLHDFTAYWNCGPYDLKACAAALEFDALQAVLQPPEDGEEGEE